MTRRKTAHDRLPIVYDPFSRRMFIRGAGATLAIPFLSSLMPRAHAQGTGPLNFVFAQTTHGRYINGWYPFGATLASAGNGVRATRLSSISGSLGRILGNNLNDLRSDINIIQGLDYQAITQHDLYPYTGGGRAHYSDGNPNNFIPNNPWTIDTILSQSSKIYPNGSPIPALRLSPKGGGGVYYGSSFSFAGLDSSGRPIVPSAYGATLASAWNYLRPFLSGTTTPPPPPTGGGTTVDVNAVQRRYLIDRVLAEFRTLSKSPNLSGEDRLALESYGDQLQDVQKSVPVAGTPSPSPTPTPSPSPVSCGMPNVTETTSNDLFNDRLIDMMVLAMTCGVTRVATYDLNWAACMSAAGAVPYSVYHSTQGGVHTAGNIAYDESNCAWTAYSVATWGKIVRKMKAAGILNNSVVVYTSDMSGSIPNHNTVDMPVLTAGSLGGKLRTGEFISYQNTAVAFGSIGTRKFMTDGSIIRESYQIRPGRRWQELLISIMKSAGLSESDYQKGGRTGFGDATCIATVAGNCGRGTNSGQGDTYLQNLLTTYYRDVYQASLNSTLPYFTL